MQILIIGYTRSDAYEEFKNYIQNRTYLATGKYFKSKQRFISESGVVIEYISLHQHNKDGRQYSGVHVSSLALKYMKPSYLQWIQSLAMEV
ncbi:hypothetical protein ABHC39_05220 [Pediococcus acidilactici]|uniref:hypothetical protein n=1 Tax=Pediococcus acidilactici TaxID=1254 RepID=UPI00232CDF4F|nr:hypothetical protein [Pediococcus acidilactici]MDB8867667.1 hypothetical protein [Pediococcus acidilactici]